MTTFLRRAAILLAQQVGAGIPLEERLAIEQRERADLLVRSTKAGVLGTSGTRSEAAPLIPSATVKSSGMRRSPAHRSRRRFASCCIQKTTIGCTAASCGSCVIAA